MSEAADEENEVVVVLFEKMREELYALREHHLEKHREACTRKDASMIVFHSGAASMYMSALDDLQERLARLYVAHPKKQRRDAAHRSHAKPGAVRCGQWWMWRLNDGSYDIPAKTASILGVDVELANAQGGVLKETTHDLLDNPRWLYLGDGPEPAQNA